MPWMEKKRMMLCKTLTQLYALHLLVLEGPLLLNLILCRTTPESGYVVKTCKSVQPTRTVRSQAMSSEVLKTTPATASSVKASAKELVHVLTHKTGATNSNAACLHEPAQTHYFNLSFSEQFQTAPLSKGQIDDLRPERSHHRTINFVIHLVVGVVLRRRVLEGNSKALGRATGMLVYCFSVL